MTAWAIIRCKSGREGRAARYLERIGYPHGWWPEEEVRLARRVYERLVAAAKRDGTTKPKSTRTRPYVPGYVFVPMEKAPDIAKIRHNVFTEWMDVILDGKEPYMLSDERMMDMRQIPERLREMIAEVEAREQFLRELYAPKVGARAKVTAGAFEGWHGVCREVGEDRVRLDLGNVIISAALKDVERVA